MATFAQHVLGLRAFFGVPDQATLPEAIALMNEQMGLDSEGSLPGQVDRLVSVTGFLLAASTVAVPAVAAAASTEPATATSEPAAADKKKKRKLSAAALPADKSQRTLFAVLPEASKTTIHHTELHKQRKMALAGESYSPRREDRNTFETEGV